MTLQSNRINPSSAARGILSMRFFIIFLALLLSWAIVVLGYHLYEEYLCGCSRPFPISLWEIIGTYYGLIFLAVILSWRSDK